MLLIERGRWVYILVGLLISTNNIDTIIAYGDGQSKNKTASEIKN